MAVFFLVVLTATVVTYILPETFRSTAEIQVEQNHSDMKGFNESQVYRQIDLLFIQTQIGVLESRAILYRVISNLDLTTKWGKKYFGGQTPKISEVYPLLLVRV